MAIPTKDSLLVGYATNFAARLLGGPTTYFVTPAQADEVSTLVGDYDNAWDAMRSSVESNMRSGPLTRAKDAAKEAMLASLRVIYANIQVNPQISDADKETIGVVVRRPPHRVPAPTQSPGMAIEEMAGRLVTVRVYDPTSASKRAKPAGVASAGFYSFVGSTYPSDPTLWLYQGQSSSNTYKIQFEESLAAGSQVWICAAWNSRRGESGPACVPQSVYVQGGALNPVKMRMAA